MGLLDFFKKKEALPSLQEIRREALEVAFDIAVDLEICTRDLETMDAFIRNRDDVLTEHGVTTLYDRTIHGDYDDTVHYWTDVIDDRTVLENFIRFRENVAFTEKGAKHDLIFAAPKDGGTINRPMKIYHR